MKKSKIIPISIIIVILIMLLIVFANTLRKTYILSKICNKSQEASQITNYYWNLKIGDREIATYRNGDKAQIIIDNGLMRIFKNGDSLNTYQNSSNGKIAKLNEKDDELNSIIKLPRLILKENISPIFVSAFNAKITDVIEDGIECYLIESSSDVFHTLAYDAKVQIFINKETGLPIKTISFDNAGKSTIAMYKYEFHNVTNDNLKEPDINDYKIV